MESGREYHQSGNWFYSFENDLKSAANLKARDPGGSAANTVAALYRMGFSTGYFGAVGAADAAYMQLHELGNDEHLRIKHLACPSGRCMSLIDAEDSGRDRALVILPNANNEVSLESGDLDYFSLSTWIHFTSFVSDGPLNAQLEVAEYVGNNVRISFDPGAVYTARGVTELLPILKNSEVLFVTEEELRDLTSIHVTEEAISALLAIGVRSVVLKGGSRGISLYARDFFHHEDAVRVDSIIDRTGAGDVAAAGFLAGSISGWSPRKSLKFAATAAARSIQGYGRASYPDTEFFDLFAGKA
jgi:ribokinase